MGAITDATLSATRSMGAESVNIPINNQRVDRMMDDRRKNISADLLAEEMERNKRENILSLPKYPPENTIPVTPSSGGTSSPIRTTPYPYPSQQSQTVDERLKSAIDQRVAEIKDKINKEVATEKRTISAGVVPSKSKFDPAKNNKTESKVGLEVKIIGMKALCRTTETVLKEVLLKNIKNNLF